MSMLSAVNFIAVLIFGTILALSFAGIEPRKNKKDYALIFCILGIMQGITYIALGEEILFQSYPFLTHLPLFLLLKYHYKKNSYLAGIAVLSAYLFCTPRKWIGTFASSFWSYHADVSYLVQIIITVPLLILIIKYVSPYVARLKFESTKILKLFISVPLIYYFVEYGITVYSDLLYKGGAAVVEFMDASIVTVYFVFSIIYLKTLYEKKEIEVEHTVLTIMADNFGKEMEQLRAAERQSAIYRHDLRHHMNYLNTCIAENKLQEARDYIAQTCADVDHMKVERYSENEPLNLILSSYAGKAREKGIAIEFYVTAMDFARFQMTDLCSLLANALENAIHSCEQLADEDCRFIHLRMFEKSNRLCLELRNSYGEEPVFENKIPVSQKAGHGIGVKSIIHVVEKYDGIYGFSAKNGEFRFQMTM